MADLRNPEGRAIGPSLETIQSAEVGIYAAEGEAWEIDEDDFGLEPYGNGFVVAPLPALEQITPQQVSDYFGDPLAITYAIDIDTADPSSDSITYPELEVRDHATQQLIASTHIQLYSLDAYDYNDCVRRMSGVFLLQGCIDVESIDAYLRLQLCDIDDPPTMMYTVFENQQWSDYVVISTYFEESGEEPSNIFQDPLKSQWIDFNQQLAHDLGDFPWLPFAAGGIGGRAHGEGPYEDWPCAPYKFMKLKACYEGKILLFACERDSTGDWTETNAWDDGIVHPRTSQEINWSSRLLYPLGGLGEEIPLPVAMVNVTDGEPNKTDKGDPDFGGAPDMGYDYSHYAGTELINSKAIHTVYLPKENTAGDPEPFWWGTKGDPPMYHLNKGDEYMFFWDGRQRQFIDVRDESVPIWLLDNGGPGIPLYFPPGKYSLSFLYKSTVQGAPPQIYHKLDISHDISIAYNAALCIDAHQTHIDDAQVDEPNPIELMSEYLTEASICTTRYDLNMQYSGWSENDEVNSGLISSFVSYSPILVYACHTTSERQIWGDLGLPGFQTYKHDFVMIMGCGSCIYIDCFDPKPSLFFGSRKGKHIEPIKWCNLLQTLKNRYGLFEDGKPVMQVYKEYVSDMVRAKKTKELFLQAYPGGDTTLCFVNTTDPTKRVFRCDD